MAFTGYKALDFSGIDKAIQGFQQRQQLASLGQNLDGTPEGYAKAAQALLQRGDTAAAANFFALGEKARERSSTLENDNRILQSLGLGGGGPMGAPRSPVAPAIQSSNSGAASPRGVVVAETPDAVASLEAQSSGLTQLGNANEPRGLRNNNPGNIESGRFAATVQGFQGSDGRFAQYATPEQGIQAADKLLTSYAGRGLNTVNGIVNRWAPPSENNTGAYAASVARELGVDPNQPLDMNNWEVRQKLIAAKIRVENGKQPYAEDVFQRALNPNWGREVAAFEGGAQPSQTAQAGPQFALGNAPPPAGQFAAPQPTQVAQAAPPAGQRVAAPIPGDNPIQLRQEAQAYAQTNPEAARQMIARAEAIEQASGVQTAQAGGDPRADQVGGAPVQGFVIPGTGEVVPAETIANNPRLKNLAAAMLLVKDPAKRAGLENMFKLELEATKERMGAEARDLDKQAKRQAIENAKTPEGVREFLYARENGLTKARTPIEYAREKAEATRQDRAPTTRTIKQPDGSEVIVQWNEDAKTWEPLRAPEGGNAVRPTGTKLTEGQSKDLIYHSRGLQALEAFEPVANAYASGPERVASQVPGGNYVVSEDFQKARQAGRNFLASVLRKDTGAAVTASEEALYGDIFLPAPGDKPGNLAQKAEARRQAIDAIRAGLGTAEVLALGKKLTTRQPGEDAPARAAPPPAAAPPPQRPAAGTPRTATNPNTGERIMLTPDGQWVPYS